MGSNNGEAIMAKARKKARKTAKRSAKKRRPVKSKARRSAPKKARRARAKKPASLIETVTETVADIGGLRRRLGGSNTFED
jgi:hypothetical protein